MDLNRHQFLFLGVVLLLVGMQVHVVQAYVLTSDATQFLAERTSSDAAQSTAYSLVGSAGAMPGKVIQPPEWLGWCLMAVGAVCILHSLAMPRPA